MPTNQHFPELEMLSLQPSVETPHSCPQPMPVKDEEETALSELTAAAFLISTVILGPVGGIGVLIIDAALRRWRLRRIHHLNSEALSEFFTGKKLKS